MPKLKILRKAADGGGGECPCPTGYICVDGKCVDESTRTYTVYETDVPGEYTAKVSVDRKGLLRPVTMATTGFGPGENYLNPQISEYYSQLPTADAKKEFKLIWNKYKPPAESYEEMHGSGKYYPNLYENIRQQKFIEEFNKYLYTPWKKPTNVLGSTNANPMGIPGLSSKFMMEGPPPEMQRLQRLADLESKISEGYTYARNAENQVKQDDAQFIEDSKNKNKDFLDDVHDFAKGLITYDWTKDDAIWDLNQILHGVPGEGLNFLQGVLYSPFYGLTNLAKSIRGDKIDIDDPATHQAAFFDWTGSSNYPYAAKSIEDLGTSAKDFYKNPSWGKAGDVVLGTVGAGMNILGSVPILSFEGSAGKELAKGLPTAAKLESKATNTVARELAPNTFTKEGLKATFTAKPVSGTRNPFNKFFRLTPIQQLGTIPFHATMGFADDVMGLPFRASRALSNRLTNPFGIGIKGSGMIPWTHGEHWYKWKNGVSPIQAMARKALGQNDVNDKVVKPAQTTKIVKQPTNTTVPPEEAPPVEAAPVIEYGMPKTYETPSAKDTIINVTSPSGQVYQTTTAEFVKNPLFKKFISLDEKSWDPDKKVFNLNPKNFIINNEAYDPDEVISTLLGNKKAYGGMNEIPSLFKYSPEKNAPGRMNYGGMPKFVAGGTPPNCDPGYIQDPENPTKCILVTDFQNRNNKYLFDKSKLASECPEGYVKDPMTFKCVPSMSSSGMSGGFNWDPDKRDIFGNVPPDIALPKQTIKDEYGNITTKGSIEMGLPTLYKTSDIGPKVGLYQCPKGYKRDKATGQCVPIVRNRGSFIDKFYDASLNFDMYTNLASGISNNLQMLGKRRAADLNNRMLSTPENMNVVSADVPGSRGNYNMQGIFRPEDLGYKTQNTGEMGGTMLTDSDMNNKIKVRIKKSSSPESMAYGGQSGYGFDLGQRNTYTAMPEGKMQTVSKSLDAIPREYANVEAEKGETVYGDIDGDGVQEHMNIGGKRHVNGGTPLNIPEGSFIFSDTKKMVIRDPQVLAKFGMAPSKKGYTPAEIAKKYDVNKYKAILQDVNADQLTKNTAQLMMKNLQRKLAELALIQESMKGFPQGIPEMCYGVLPDEMLEQIQQQLGAAKPENPIQRNAPQNAQEMPESDQSEPNEGTPEEQSAPEEELEPGMQMYGGMYTYGGNVYDEEEDMPMYATGGPWEEKIKKLQKITGKKITWSDRYKAHDTDIPSSQGKQESGRYGDITLLEATEWMDRHSWYFKHLARPGWDYKNINDVKDFQEKYNERARAKGLDEDFFDSTKTEGTDALDGKLGEYTYNAPDLSDEDTPPPPPPEKIFGYKCTGRDEKGNPQIGPPREFKDAAERTAAGYVESMQAAYAQCPPGGNTPPPGTIEDKKKITKVPFKYLTPDKWKLAAAMGSLASNDNSFIPDVSYQANNFIPEEWRAKAAQLQGLTRQTGEQIGTYKGGNATAADISNLYSQAANKLVDTISEVDARNIAGVNPFNAQEAVRKDKFNLLRASNAQQRAEQTNAIGRAAAAFLNKKTAAVVDQAANMWNNRMQLGLMNATNKFYYTDPTTGMTVFKGGYGPEDIGKTAGTNYSTSPEEFRKFQTDYMGSDGKPPTYNDYIKWKEQQGSSGKAAYGGTIKIKVTPSYYRKGNDIADMLAQGYGLPF